MTKACAARVRPSVVSFALRRLRVPAHAAALLTAMAIVHAPRVLAAEPVDRLKARVYADYRRLDPSHVDHPRMSDWDKVRMLREFSYRHTAYSNHVDSRSYKAGAAMVDRVARGEAPLIEAYEFFDRSEGGVICGHAAMLLERLYAEFGFDAWTVGHGFYPRTEKGSGFTHAETLVRITDGDASQRRTLITLHDPSTNISHTRADGGAPLDYFELLRLVVQGRANEIGTSGAVDDGIERSHPATVCLPDESAGHKLDDYLGAWNIHDRNHRLVEIEGGRWRIESPRSMAEFNRLGDVIWKPELIKEGVPGQTIYIHCFPFDVGGGRADCRDLLAKAKETVAASRPAGSASGATKATAGDAASIAKAPFPLPGEWVQYRGNRSLDGHVSGKGAITNPHVAWKMFVGSVASTLVVEPAAASTPQKSSNATMTVDATRRAPPADAAWQRRWFPPPPSGMIEGHEQTWAPTSTMTFSDILPDTPGLERVTFASGFSQPTHNGDWTYGPGRLESWQDGRWQTVWQTKIIDHCFNPYPLVGDFDADGQPEIAVLPWRSLQIYDARSGALEAECKFTDGRSYGYFGAHDLDGDGKHEFVVLSDFAKHAEALGFRDGRLELLWQHEIELDISNPQKIFHVLPDPVADVDGDGRKDVVLDLYNETGDGKWHMVVRDGPSGAIKADLVDEIAQGVADLDNDGRCELLTAATEGRIVPDFGAIRVRAWKDGALGSRWEAHDQGWCDQPAPVVLNCWRYDRHALSALVRNTDRGPAVVLRKRVAERPQAVELCVAVWKDSGFERGPAVRGRDVKALALDRSGALLAEFSASPPQEAELEIIDGRAQCVGSVDKPCSLTPPVVVRDGRDPRPLLIAGGAERNVVAWRPPFESKAAQVMWRRASAPGPAPIAVSLKGNGERQVILGSRSEKGFARLVAADALTGETVWQRDFERFSAGQDAWNPGGFVSCYAGNFADATRQDLLVTLSRSMMHGEETFLISGADGREIWHRDRQIAQRSVSGPFAVADFNGDGHDDAASFFPSIHYILDGPTGRDLLAGENRWKQIPIKTVYWGRPVALLPGGSRNPELVFASTHMVGVVHRDGNLSWSDAYDQGVACMPGVGDFDGDGHRELVFAGFADGVRCYDAGSGRLRWTLAVAKGAQVDSVISGDINGDGRDEAVFVVGPELYCIGAQDDGNAGRIVWRLELPATAGAPALAAIGAGDDRDGKGLSILVTGADGHVYCIR